MKELMEMNENYLLQIQQLKTMLRNNASSNVAKRPSSEDEEKEQAYQRDLAKLLKKVSEKEEEVTML